MSRLFYILEYNLIFKALLDKLILMNTPILPAGFSLERFVDVFLDEALKNADKELTLGKFYRRIYSAMKEEGVSKAATSYLHHSLHWTLFLEPSNSPIKLENVISKSYSVIAKRPVSESDFNNLKEYVVKNHGVYLQSRVRNISPKVS